MSPDEIAPKAPPNFQMHGIFCSKADFEVVIGDGFVVPSGRPPRVGVNITISASIKLVADGGAFVELETNVVPDQQWQPYRIIVKMTGAFKSADATPEEITAFTRRAAPSILFPYIRETVSRLTTDAPFGAVKLDPMNISLLLNQSDWGHANATPSASTEPEQHSEQSPSASPE